MIISAFHTLGRRDFVCLTQERATKDWYYQRKVKCNSRKKKKHETLGVDINTADNDICINSHNLSKILQDTVKWNGYVKCDEDPSSAKSFCGYSSSPGSWTNASDVFAQYRHNVYYTNSMMKADPEYIPITNGKKRDRSYLPYDLYPVDYAQCWVFSCLYDCSL